MNSHHIMQSMAAPLRWGLNSAWWAAWIDWLSWKRNEGGDLHWFASSGKSVFQNLVFGLAYPTFFKRMHGQYSWQRSFFFLFWGVGTMLKEFKQGPSSKSWMG